MNPTTWPGPLERPFNSTPIQAVLSQRHTWWQKKGYKTYLGILNHLPVLNAPAEFSIEEGVVHIGAKNQLTDEQFEKIHHYILQLKSWKKGPFNLFGLEVDAEWRSDFKFDRLAPHLPNLTDKVVLDIGANNGYFMFQLSKLAPKSVIGIDPVVHFHTQFHLLNHFAKRDNLFHHLLGVEHLIHFENSFDVILSMGILYHHKNPLQQLMDIKKALKPNGQLFLETIGLPGDEEKIITPNARYCGMKNVWFLPTLKSLLGWIERTGFIEASVLSTQWQKEREQRTTPWSNSPSYSGFIDPKNPELTIEGLPAPQRFLIKVS